MNFHQEAVNVRLIVKASSPARAAQIVRDRLKLCEWFCEDVGDAKPLIGFPEGSLLSYSVEAAVLVPKSQPIAAIQG